MPQTQEKVIELIADMGFLDHGMGIDPETLLKNDLGFDSLDKVELVIECEKEFKIAITNQDQEKITTVGEIVDYIEKKVELKNKHNNG